MPCLAQQPPGSSPAAGFSADIAGIRIGMAPQQAAVAVRAANLIAALREKYGPEDGSATAPAVAKASGFELRDAYWIYDANGQRLPKQRAAQLAMTCTQIWASSYLDRLKLPQNPTFTNPNAANCFGNTVVLAYLTPTTPGVTGPPGSYWNLW